MKYKLRNELNVLNEQEFETITDMLLYNRGINDFVEYQELSIYETCDYMNLDNIENAVKMMVFHLQRGDNISILVDTDPDGYTSAAILYNYLKTKVRGKLNYIMHQEPKAHGLGSHDFIIPNDTRLLIIPDAGTNDFTECKEINHLGCDVLILDHHEAEKMITQDKHIVVVNNQISDRYWNKALSGVGIVYKFLQAMDNAIGVIEADRYIDLVALGNISDVMDARSCETKYYIQEGLSSIRSKAFKALIDAQEFSIKGVVNMHNIAWYITSIMNGCIRYGKPEERELLFRAFIDDYEEFDYKKRNGEVIKEDIYNRAARICTNAKSRQDRAKQKAINTIIDKCKSDTHKVIICDITDILDRELTGVAAIKIADTLKKPCILLHKARRSSTDTDAVYSGSGRNYDHSPIESFKDICNETGKFIFAQGHANAFGVKIYQKDVDDAIKEFDCLLNDVTYENVYLVDEIIDGDEEDGLGINIEICSAYADFDDYVGNGIDEPLVAIENLEFSRSDFNIVGNKKDTIQIKNEDSDVRFVMFRCDPENHLLNWINNTWDQNELIVLNVVGSPQINVYEGIRSAQFVIKDYELAEGDWSDLDDDDGWD